MKVRAVSSIPDIGHIIFPFLRAPSAGVHSRRGALIVRSFSFFLRRLVLGLGGGFGGVGEALAEGVEDGGVGVVATFGLLHPVDFAGGAVGVVARGLGDGAGEVADLLQPRVEERGAFGQVHDLLELIQADAGGQLLGMGLGEGEHLLQRFERFGFDVCQPGGVHGGLEGQQFGVEVVEAGRETGLVRVRHGEFDVVSVHLGSFGRIGFIVANAGVVSHA